jgi:FkbM family methyltransferase
VHTIQLAKWAAQGRVFAFEPGPAAATILRRHVRMNGLEERVEVVEAAVGSTEGHATLFTDGADVMGRLEAPNPLIRDSARPVTVSVVSLDAFCGARGIRPDWVVMDIEGFEVAALRGGGRLLGDPAVEFVVEMHPSIWSFSDGASRAELEEILRRASRVAVPLSGQSDPLAEHGMVHLAVRGVRASA